MDEELTTTQRLAQSIARAVDRRSFLKQAGTAVFAVLVGVATGKFTQVAEAYTNSTCSCSPPGPYCTNCRGANCYQDSGHGTMEECRLNRNYYPSGTWTSYCTGGRGVVPGYFVCTDCFCGASNYQCGCREFRTSKSPVVAPGLGRQRSND